MRTRALSIFFGGLLFSSAFYAQTPQAAEPVFRLDVRLVQVDAQVLDKKTRHMTPLLKQEDFQVLEDDVPQKISSFSQDKLPLSIVILFDLTDSVRPVLKSLAGTTTIQSVASASRSSGVRVLAS